MDLTTVAMIAVPIASFGGAIMGQKVNMGWVKEKLAEHDQKHKSHEKRLAGHDLTLGLLENRK